MPQFVMNRDRIVPTLSGHCIRFKKDEPTHVPAHLVSEVMNAGAVPVEELPEEETVRAETGENDPALRKQKILEAFAAMAARNQRGDFDAAGRPHPKPLSALCGFRVDAKERDRVWEEYMESANGA